MLTTTGTPLTLDDEHATDAGRVGTKAAGLARLRQAGFPVPDALLLDVELLASWPPRTPAPDAVHRAVETAVQRLDGPLAVRSSATWEDGSTHAHAGATTTLLDVEGVEDVLTAVRSCLDGSAEAMAGVGVAGGVAVVLQRLVAADAAGVAFTADPLTGERDVVRIAAVEGLAEGLVAGEVTGSDVVVRGDEVVGDTGPLTFAQTRAVADLARRVEAAFGEPQDVEWVLSGDDVELVQARPITVLPVAPALPEGTGWQKDTTHYPEPMTTFGYGVLTFHEAGVEGVFAEHGLLVRGVESALAGGEVYARILPAFGPAEAKGPPPPAWLLGLLARVLPPLRRLDAAARRALELDLRARWVTAWREHERAWFVDRVTQLRAADLTALDDAALDARLVEVLDLTKDGAVVHFRLFMSYLESLHALHRFTADRLGWDDATTQLLLAGHSPASRAGADEMAGLRARVASSAAATAALAATPRDPVAALREVDPALAADVVAWIDGHGWAALNYDAGVPALAERPAMVTRLLLADDAPAAADRAAALEDEALATLGADGRATFASLLAAARERYGLREDNVSWTGDRVLGLARRWLLEAARRLVERGILPATDDAAHLAVDELRDALAGRPADDLLARVRRRRGEEAWARANPGPTHLGESGPPPDVSRLPATLRAMNEPILWAVGLEYPEPPDEADRGDADLVGVAASPGVAEGVVRVVRGHADLDRLRDGEVMVCTVTTPAWAPVFPLCAAVVADGGGALAHAAIAAREHGRPAVLGTGDATRRLHDGQRVRVDGTRGEVTLL